VLAASLLAVSACAPLPPRADPARAGVETSAVDAAASMAPRFDARAAASAYAGARTYAGALACPGCDDQRITLTIFADGTFRMRQLGAAAAYDIGRWSRSAEAADLLVLRGDTEGVRVLRRVAPDALVIVDNEGRALRGAAEASLSRVAQIDPLGGPLRLVGHYHREGRDPVFVECLTGQRMPVVTGAATPALRAGAAPSADARAQSALDAAHHAVSSAPADPVLAIVRGYLLPRLARSDSPGKEALVVTGFERAMRDGRCEDVVRKPR
jgi:hypothetical protein